MVSTNSFIARLLLTGVLTFAHALDARAGPAVPIVDLGYAKYAGSFNVTTHNTQFLGMRYAAPPIGWYLLIFRLAKWLDNTQEHFDGNYHKHLRLLPESSRLTLNHRLVSLQVRGSNLRHRFVQQQ